MENIGQTEHFYEGCKFKIVHGLQKQDQLRNSSTFEKKRKISPAEDIAKSELSDLSNNQLNHEVMTGKKNLHYQNQ